MIIKFLQKAIKILLLLSLTPSFSKTDIDPHKLFNTKKIFTAEINEHYDRVIIHFNTNLDSAKHYLNLIESKIDTNNDYHVIAYQFLRGKHHNSRKNTHFYKHVSGLIDGLQRAEKHELYFYKAAFNNLLGISYLESNSDLALSHFTKSYQLAKLYNYRELMLISSGNLAVYYSRLDMLETADYWLNIKGKILFSPKPLPKDGNHLFYYYLVKSSVETEYSVKRQFLIKAITTAEENVLISQKYQAIEFLCRLYNDTYETIDYANGILTLEQYIDYENLDEVRFACKLLFRLSKAYTTLHKRKKAERIFRIYSLSCTEEIVERNYNYMGYLVFKESRIDSALKYLDAYNKTLIKEHKIEKDSLNMKYEREFQVKRINADMKLLEEKTAVRNKIEIVVIFSLVIIAVVIIFFARRIIRIKNEENLLTKESLSKELESNAFRSAFLTQMSKEIQTPLALIMGTLDHISQKGNYSLEVETFDMLLYSVTKLNMDTKNMIHFIDNQSVILDDSSQKVLLLDEMNHKILEQSIKLKQKFIHVSVEHNITQQTEAFISLKKYHLIIETFLDNGIKYSPSRMPIEIKIEIINDQLIISFTNYGNSISGADINEMFKSYGEIDREFLKKYDLKLTIISDLALQLNGRISGNTTEQNGIQLTFTCPITHTGKLLGTSLKTKIVLPEYRNSIDTNSLKKSKPEVLVILGQEMFSHFYKLILTEFNCTFKYNIQDTFDLLNENEYDTILFCVDDLEKAKGFIESFQNKALKIPIILVAPNYNLFSDLDNMSFDIVIDLLIKPFNVELLIQKIKNFCRISPRLNKASELFEENHFESQLEGMQLNIPDDKFVKRVIEIIERHMKDNNFNVKKLAEEVFYSESQLRNLLKSKTGFTPRQLILEIRLISAYQVLLSNKELKVKEVQFAVGIKDSAYFSKTFKKRFGSTPSEFKDKLG